jgi:hypothetical protein
VEDEKWVRQRTPAGRWGDVEDLGGTLIYFVSPASAFAHGQLVHVDGGCSRCCGPAPPILYQADVPSPLERGTRL